MRGKKTDLGNADCAISRSLEIIGDWWSLLIIRDALVGSQRFGEFQKNIGLAKNILASRLKKLVEDRIFIIEKDPNSPSVPRYVLTERGKGLALVIACLWQWGEENCFSDEDEKYGLADSVSGQMFAKIELKAANGNVIDLNELKMTLRPRADIVQRPQS